METSHRSGFGTSSVIFYTLFTFAAMACAGTYSGGSGTAEDPYKISTVADWQELSTASIDWDKFFILTDNLDLKTITLTPIGQFTGEFDGNSHEIQNIVINQPGRNNIGLFGNLGSGGNIQNLSILNANIFGQTIVGSLVGVNSGNISSCNATGIVSGISYVGGLVGKNSGTMVGCSATTDSKGSGNYLGGLVGYNDGNVITCHANGAVNGSGTYVGGLAGYNNNNVASCYTNCNLTSTGDWLGGLIGRNEADIKQSFTNGVISGNDNIGGIVGRNSGNVISCYTIGDITGKSYLGGIAALNSGSIITCYTSGNIIGGGDYLGGIVATNQSGSVNSSYAIGTITGKDYVGGLVGWNDNNSKVISCYSIAYVEGTGDNLGGLIAGNAGVVTSCFWDLDASGQLSSNGGTGLPTTIMLNTSVYLRAFWDFVGETINGTADIWIMPPLGRYPILTWQIASDKLPNDEMVGAISVEPGVPIPGTSSGGTGLDLTVNGYNDCLDVWYLFTPSLAGKYTIQVKSSDFDTTVAVFDEAEREIAFNDDFFGDQSAVILKARAGVHYYIRIAGQDGQEGNFSLTISEGAIQSIQGDLNYDGIVNLSDMSIFAANWLQGI